MSEESHQEMEAGRAMRSERFRRRMIMDIHGE